MYTWSYFLYFYFYEYTENYLEEYTANCKQRLPKRNETDEETKINNFTSNIILFKFFLIL